MASYVVIGVRREPAADGSHDHVAGVCAPRGLYYSRAELVASIRRGDVWELPAHGEPVTVVLTDRCPRCEVSPYVATARASLSQPTLESLADC